VATYHAVILDIDGTLLDSNDAHADAWVDVGREFGYDIPWKKARRLIGMGGDKVLPALTGLEKNDPAGRRIADRRGEIFRGRYLPTLRPTPGTRALLERMREEGRKLVVATSASADDLDGLLDATGGGDLIESSTSAGDAERSKPDADIVLAALEETGCPPNQVVMIGDTPYDVEAAGRAGVDIIAVRCGGWGDDELRGAVAIFDDPADLLENYDLSPLGRLQ
jgi:phosphoglycolate phosphatase-like HAD superfamily hydrolase